MATRLGGSSKNTHLPGCPSSIRALGGRAIRNGPGPVFGSEPKPAVKLVARSVETYIENFLATKHEVERKPRRYDLVPFEH
jgi:hypothetical protein